MGDEPVSAYVLGLLADLERQVAELDATLQVAQERARAVDAQLQATAARYVTARDAARKNRERAAQAAARIAASNGELNKLHQEMGTLQRKSDELREIIRQSVDPDAQNQLRRQRATYLLALEDREKVLKALTETATRARARLHKAQQADLLQSDTERQESAALDALRQHVPRPQLFLQLFEARAGRGHCLFYLDRDRHLWQRELTAAVGSVREMHAALRAGRYRLDHNSDVVGGRALASVEAIYSLAALGDWNAARDLFALICDANLFFHHIFHVFRAWCLGLYLTGRHAELQELVTLHMYVEGMQGAYARAFLALLQRDQREFERAVKRLVAGQWQQLRRLPQAALGVVNVNALTLCRLAVAARLRPPQLGVTVPPELLQS